jgi:tetratricopeptide (TPR) repeat protein
MKLSSKAYNFAQKILKLNEKEEKAAAVENIKEIKDERLIVKDDKRIIGKTDYRKYEIMANNLELDDITNQQKTKDALKMGCNNDRRKERQLMEKPYKTKIEAAKIFKNEGDDFLKTKNYTEAINSYEKALLQLFYTFSDNPEEDREVEMVKAPINMNMAMCKINLNKFEEAIGYCQEALRIDKANLKAIYRVAFSYFKLEKFDDSRKAIQDGLKLQPDSSDFKSLIEAICKREKEMEDQSRKLFKKIMK